VNLEENNQSPFFSVVVPTHNRAHFLSKAIESVLAQTCTDWELIIIDDGSTDNTKELVEQFTDKRIHYVWQENQERSAARNNGITISRGQYICFLDSDDYYLDDRLEVFHKEISDKEMPIAFLYTGICFETNGEIVPREELPNIYKSMMDYIVYNVVGSPQVCIHRHILEQYKFDIRFNLAEDTELWVRIIHAGFPFIYLNYCNVIASNHDERSVSMAKGNSYAKMLSLYNYMFTKPHPGSTVSKSMQHFVMSNINYCLARYFLYVNNKRQAIFCLVKSILLFVKGEQTRHKMFLLSKLLFIKKGNCKDLLRFIGGV